MLSVHNMPEKFQNGVFILDNEMLSVHNTPEKFENELIPVFLDLFLRKTQARKSHSYYVIVFERLCFQNAFCSH